jgi:hypothetical protein
MIGKRLALPSGRTGWPSKQLKTKRKSALLHRHCYHRELPLARRASPMNIQKASQIILNKEMGTPFFAQLIDQKAVHCPQDDT